ncbi:MmcQ/YjbR family DNA-binding protein [uncultured Rikenella sp.]|uniref:MmcQ/YjbR family DNA-binding protein n=1 Tax=uncultured Rikenella sp. TaxID=368003 RepID=UPI0026325405|nr:MmcQ/YjbR family DNA-binding protein [uncultured Rikenella sp.]
MDIEDFRAFCLSLPESSERMPFQAFKSARSILAFYIGGKIFCFFDIDRFESCTVKCEPERIEELKIRYHAVGDPYNMSHRHWIGIRFNDDMPDRKIKQLVQDSYDLVRCGTTKAGK